MRSIAVSIRDALRPAGDAKGQPTLDLLVITHEHWDHISGFDDSQARDIFSEIDVRQIWMAWTEDPKDATAIGLQKGLGAARVALTSSLLHAHSVGLAPGSALLTAKTLAFFGIDQETLAEHANDVSQAPDPRAATALLALAISRGTRSVRDWIRDELNKDRKQANRYLRPCDNGRTIALHEEVPDARVYVLGPPEDSR